MSAKTNSQILSEWKTPEGKTPPLPRSMSCTFPQPVERKLMLSSFPSQLKMLKFFPRHKDSCWSVELCHHHRCSDSRRLRRNGCLSDVRVPGGKLNQHKKKTTSRKRKSENQQIPVKPISIGSESV